MKQHTGGLLTKVKIVAVYIACVAVCFGAFVHSSFAASLDLDREEISSFADFSGSTIFKNKDNENGIASSSSVSIFDRLTTAHELASASEGTESVLVYKKVLLKELFPSLTGVLSGAEVMLPNSYAALDAVGVRDAQFAVAVLTSSAMKMKDGKTFLFFDENEGEWINIEKFYASNTQKPKFRKSVFQGLKTAPVEIVSAQIESKSLYALFVDDPSSDRVIFISFTSDVRDAKESARIWNTFSKSVLTKSDLAKGVKKEKKVQDTRLSKIVTKTDEFSITLPEGWIIDQSDGFNVSSPNKPIMVSITGGFDDAPEYIPEMYDLWIDTFKTSYDEKAENLKIIETKKAKINGAHGFVFDFTHTLQGFKLHSYQLMLFKEGSAYTLTANTADESVWSKYKNVVKKSFQTFSFNN